MINQEILYLVIFGLAGLWIMFAFEMRRIRKKYNKLREDYNNSESR